MADLLPIDLDAIQRGVDAFFQRLGDLSEEWRDGRVLEKMLPWLLAASFVGYGWIHVRNRHLLAAQARFPTLRCLRGGPVDFPIFLPGEEG